MDITISCDPAASVLQRAYQERSLELSAEFSLLPEYFVNMRESNFFSTASHRTAKSQHTLERPWRKVRR